MVTMIAVMVAMMVAVMGSMALGLAAVSSSIVEREGVQQRFSISQACIKL